jgi:hypothetical protein
MSASDPQRRNRLDVARALAAPHQADETDLREVLDATEIAVDLTSPDDPAQVLAAAAIGSMAVRLVGRVALPSVRVPQPNPWEALLLPDVVAASRIEPGPPPEAVTHTVVVGIGPSPRTVDGSARGITHLHVGGDDWTAVVSRRRAAGIGPCPLGGMGLQAAAALAVGEILKDLLGPVGMRHVASQGDLVWNLLDGQRLRAPLPLPLRPPLPTPAEPFLAPPVAVLGVGAVGSSAVAALSMTPLVGTAEVVDTDRFRPGRNAYRCPGVPANEGRPKADWAERTLRRAGWVVRSHLRTLGSWATALPQPGFPGLALVSVDTYAGRRDASNLLAATTVSAGVAGLACHVHRHLAVDDLACPYCAFVDIAERTPNQTESRADQKVSAPHVSWLAGTLLAAEVVKAAVGLPGLDRRVELDLSGVPLGGWRRPRQDRSGRCPCSNPFRRRLARALYDG